MCPAASSHQQPSLPESRNWWTPICSDAQVAAICRANVASLATRDGKDFAGIGVENHRPLVVGTAPARFAGRCPRLMFSGMVD